MRSSKTAKRKPSMSLTSDSKTKIPHIDPQIKASINAPTMSSASTSANPSRTTSTATSPLLASTSTLPASTTLDTLIAHHLSRATTTELDTQLRTYLLARASHRLANFWRRHTPSSPSLQNIPETHLLAAAQAYVTRHAMDEQGNLRKTFEASYTTGPGEKKGTWEGREKYEIFEDIEVTRKGEGEKENRELGKLMRQGEAVAAKIIDGDVAGFWTWIVDVKVECESTLKLEAKEQGVVWEGAEENLGKLKRTKGVERALKLLGVRVEVEVRMKLGKVGVFKKVEGQEDMVGAEESVRRTKKAQEGKGKSGAGAREEQPRGRKRRSSDDMGFGGFRGAFQRS